MWVADIGSVCERRGLLFCTLSCIVNAVCVVDGVRGLYGASGRVGLDGYRRDREKLA